MKIIMKQDGFASVLLESTSTTAAEGKSKDITATDSTTNVALPAKEIEVNTVAEVPEGENIEVPEGENLEGAEGENLEGTEGENLGGTEGENLEVPEGENLEGTDGEVVNEGTVIDEGSVDLGMDGGMIGGGEMFGEVGLETAQAKGSVMSSWVFVIGISVATLAISIVLGILLAKKRIKKGFDLYED